MFKSSAICFSLIMTMASLSHANEDKGPVGPTHPTTPPPVASSYTVAISTGNSALQENRDFEVESKNLSYAEFNALLSQVGSFGAKNFFSGVLEGDFAGGPLKILLAKIGDQVVYYWKFGQGGPSGTECVTDSNKTSPVLTPSSVASTAGFRMLHFASPSADVGEIYGTCNTKVTPAVLLPQAVPGGSAFTVHRLLKPGTKTIVGIRISIDGISSPYTLYHLN